jgi:nicotinate-nucleotide adenylyltransferase
MSPLALLGGTFDPIHNGHLRMALECAEQADLDEVRIVPLHTPPHRQAPAATPEQRLVMARLAVQGVARLAVDDSEIRRGGASYTIDTVLALRRALGDRPLCLIMGMDAFAALDTWRQWTSLLECVHIIVVERPGNETRIESEDVASLLESRSTDRPGDLHDLPAGRILKLPVPLLDISATRIRRIVAEGRDPSFLLPDAVIDYIRKERLYLARA